MSKIMGFLVIIITLAMAPSIVTANTAVASGNLTNLIGMDVVTDFGAPLIILLLLGMGGIFAWKGAGGGMKEVMGVIGGTILAIVALTFMNSIITYINALITADSSSIGDVIYGIIPLIIYMAIVAGAGYGTYRAFKGSGKKTSKAVSGGWV
jgi:hypothetical protein